jgi:hypothetical protein
LKRRDLVRSPASPIFAALQKDLTLGVTLDLSRAPAKAPVAANLTGLSRTELAAALVDADVVPAAKAKMRAGQIWRWIHHYGVTDFAAMTDVAKETARRWPRPSAWPGPEWSSARSPRTARASG